jgi:hypothetical protein
MTAIATFASGLDADLQDEQPAFGKRSVQVIGIALDDSGSSGERLQFVIVDHDGRGSLVPASRLVFTDDSVTPPKYG